MDGEIRQQPVLTSEEQRVIAARAERLYEVWHFRCECKQDYYELDEMDFADALAEVVSEETYANPAALKLFASEFDYARDLGGNPRMRGRCA